MDARQGVVVRDLVLNLPFSWIVDFELVTLYHLEDREPKSYATKKERKRKQEKGKSLLKTPFATAPRHPTMLWKMFGLAFGCVQIQSKSIFEKLVSATKCSYQQQQRVRIDSVPVRALSPANSMSRE